MNTLITMLEHPVAVRIGWSLVHLLWQGMLIAALLAGVLWLLRRRSANARYLCAGTALLSLPVLFAATFATVDVREDQNGANENIAANSAPNDAVASNSATEPNAGIGELKDFSVEPYPSTTDERLRFHNDDDVPKPAPVASTSGNIEPQPQASQANNEPASLASQLSAGIEPLLPWVVGGWLIGFALLSLWHAGGWIALRRLRTLGTSQVTGELSDRFDTLCHRLGLRRPIGLLQSTRVTVPSLIGMLKPVVLLPVGVLTGLTPRQLEAVLAHELAHVRRHDFLANLVQTAIETLLFFHPAVWWMSRRIRIERENCCDDIAIAALNDPVFYAKSLTRLEELRHQSMTAPALSLAASGGSLLDRIHRVLGVPRRKPRRLQMSAFGLSGIAGLLALVAASSIIVPAAIKEAPAELQKAIKPGDGDVPSTRMGGITVLHEMPLAEFKSGATVSLGNGSHRFDEVPKYLQGRRFTRRGGYQGIIKFRVEKAQRVYFAVYGADWGGGGNASGGWQKELVTREQLKKQGWKEVGKIVGEHTVPDGEKISWPVFARNCKAGESFAIRTHKYQAPILFSEVDPKRAKKTKASREWHQLIKGKLATVSVHKALYEQMNGRHFLARIRVTNVSDRTIGIDLMSKHGIRINQWGASATKQRGIIDEARMIRDPFKAADKAKLTAAFRKKELQMIPAGKSIEFFRAFNGREVDSVRKAVDAAKGKYVILSMDGEVRVTNGRAAEVLGCGQPGDADVVIEQPVKWNTVPAGSRILPRDLVAVSAKPVILKQVKSPEDQGKLSDAVMKINGERNRKDTVIMAAGPKPKPGVKSLSAWYYQRRKGNKLAEDRDTWALFRSKQMNDNDRMWVHSIKREDNTFTITMQRKIWSGAYFKNLTFHEVHGVNLGKLPVGKYAVNWVIANTGFKEFDRNGWPKLLPAGGSRSVDKVSEGFVVNAAPNRKVPQPAKWNPRADKRPKPALHDIVRGPNHSKADEFYRAKPLEQMPVFDIAHPEARWFGVNRKAKYTVTTKQNNWLLFRTKQADDQVKTWVTGIERKGDTFTIRMTRSIWVGNYTDNITYHDLIAINLGKLPAGKYTAKWIIDRASHTKFDRKNWPTNGGIVKKNAVASTTTFQVASVRKDGDDKTAQILKQITNPKQRGTLRDGHAKLVWAEYPYKPDLLYAPPFAAKPKGHGLSEWFDSVKFRRKRHQATPAIGNGLLFRTRPVGEHDRLWIERIERRGNAVTVKMRHSVWKGKAKNKTAHYEMFAVDIGKLPVGRYTAKWIVDRTSHTKRDTKGWPTDSGVVKKNAVVLSTSFAVVDAKKKAADRKREASEKKDLAALNGIWEVQHTINKGKKIGLPFDYYRWIFDTKLRSITTDWKEKGIGGKRTVSTNRFTLDVLTSPKQLTITGPRLTLKGIYEFKGKTLRIGIFGIAEKDRPKSFDHTTAGKGAGSLVIFVLKRKEKPKPKVKRGAIRAVDPRTKIAWINLGSADKLKAKTTFEVRGTSWFPGLPGALHGTVEVTRIVGPHLAEARIVSESAKESIRPGDVAVSVVNNKRR